MSQFFKINQKQMLSNESLIHLSVCVYVPGPQTVDLIPVCSRAGTLFTAPSMCCIKTSQSRSNKLKANLSDTCRITEQIHNSIITIMEWPGQKRWAQWISYKAHKSSTESIIQEEGLTEWLRHWHVTCTSNHLKLLVSNWPFAKPYGGSVCLE